MTRLAFRICGVLLVLPFWAQAQEPDQQPQPETRPQSHRDIRLGRPAPPTTQWYPDPAPPGAQAQANPMRQAPPQQFPAQGAAAQPANQGSAPNQPPATVLTAPQPSPELLGPATPPQVAYRDGQLTVQASNSTLESVLTAIRNKAGIQFEGLEGGISERVVLSMGPAPEGEVLAAILGGSKYDYVAIDRPDSPGIVQRVILTARSGGAGASGQRAVSSAPSSGTESGDEEEVPDEQANADPDAAPQDTPARPPVMQAQPRLQPNQPQPQQQQLPAQQPQSTTNPKTPEQLLEDLKQMQQRQQQQQQQQQQSPHQQPPF